MSAGTAIGVGKTERLIARSLRGQLYVSCLLITATLGLQPGTAFAQNIFGIIEGLTHFHGHYSYSRSRTHHVSRHRSARAGESENPHGSQAAGESVSEGRGPNLTPAR
jgi:hypothetical protein